MTEIGCSIGRTSRQSSGRRRMTFATDTLGPCASGCCAGSAGDGGAGMSDLAVMH